jgi:FPC/CPF motif-containing protein YcgG
VFAVAGFELDQLRFGFNDRLDGAWLAPVLKDYLRSAREFGPNTSLVAFSRPGPVAGLESFRARFWALLKDLAGQDPSPWPSGVSQSLTDSTWEFCFAGEAIFVVCNTPAHVLRQSRRASAFMVTFQPRWVFESILATPACAEKAFAKVRRRLTTYDMLPLSPALGRYGEPGVLEHEQYFLSDDNERQGCPFTSLRDDKPSSASESEKAA